MNAIETILIIAMIMVVGMTAVAEPVLSMQYGKAVVTSTFKFIKVVKDLTTEITSQMTATPTNSTNRTRVIP